jgi:hypothetical protein
VNTRAPSPGDLDAARRRADRADARDPDAQRGAVEGRPGERAGEYAYAPDGYGELYGEGDWGWRGQYDHRYGEYPPGGGLPADRRGWDPRREGRPPHANPQALGGRYLPPGPFTGRGPKGYRRADSRILEEVCDRLTQHGRLDASDMEVSVENGEVTLTGQVDSRWAKREAEAVADTVSGVRDVHNRLVVKAFAG